MGVDFMSKVCKVTAIVFFVLSVIAAVIQLISYTLGWYSFFYTIIAGFVFSLFFYAIGEIIEQLEVSNSNTYELYQLIKNAEQKKENNITASAPPAPKLNYDAEWECKNCGTKNAKDARFCRNCGEHR